MLGAALLSCTNQSASTSSPPPSAAPTQAADLRVRLNLLLSEHVMIVTKELEAEVIHSDQYASYTSLLATNSGDLSAVIGSAFGNTAALQFTLAWNAQNGYLVDYTIGVVTHNDGKAKAAMAALTASAPQFAQLINAMSRVPLDQATQLTSQRIADDKAFIDDVFAGNYASYYSHLDSAYAHTSRLGDALATELAHIHRPQLVDQVNAMIKVIDDQRAKSSKTVANDDRAAATAMQPVADSIQG